ncbi:DUF4314 domain-containing protein [bacterium]|nr:DUF4314 domain-containing protein [bacterium]
MSYQKGDRVRLVRMGDDPDPVAPGTEGVVVHTADLYFPGERPQMQVSVNWDNGRSLSCIVPPDVLIRVDSAQP